MNERVEGALADRLVEVEPQQPLPVVLLCPPGADDASLDELESRVGGLGGGVRRRFRLSGSIAVDIPAKALVTVLDEFRDVNAELDAPGELERT